MRPIHLLLSVLVVAVVLSVAWFLASDNGRAPAEAAAGRGAAPATPAAKQAEPSAPESNAAPATSTPERVATEELAPAAPNRPAAAPAKRDSLALTGVVHDPSGKPVAGAIVLAANSGDGFFASMPIDLLGGRRRAWLPRSETTTGADGRFELTGVKPGATQVAVRASGYAPRDVRGVDVPAGERHDVGVIELAASVIVEGRVVDARGRGVANAKIERIHESTGGFMMFDGSRAPGVEVATTRADGSYTVDQLAAGAFKLRATSEEHPDKVEAGTTSQPGERVTLNIVVDDGYEIAGRVVGVPPEQQRGLRVRASPSRADADPNSDFDFDMPFDGGSETREALAKGDGTFVVRGLREGKSYSVRARAAEDENEPFAPALSPRVIARAGDRGVELVYQPETALVFTVVDARTRKPIEEFSVEAGIEWRMPMPRQEGAKRDIHPGGQVRFGGLRPKSASDKASLAVQAVGYRKLEMNDIALAAGRDTELGLLALDPVPVTRVTVLDDSSGAAVAGARVTLRKAPEPVTNATFGHRVAMRVGDAGEAGDFAGFDDDESVSGVTDENGLAVLTSFEGAKSRIDVRAADYAQLRSEEFTAAIGQPEEHTLRLRRGGSVRVTLKNADGSPVAGGRVDHQRTDDEGIAGWEFSPGEGSRYVTNAEGVVVFDHLAEGAHRFRPHDTGGNGVFGDGNMTFAIAGMPDSDSESWTEVAVTEGNTAELTLVAPARSMLSGRVREAGEKLAGATVSLAPRSDDRGPGGMRMPPMFGGGPSAKTDGAGRYELADVKAGEYTLTVTHPSRQMPAEFEVTLGEEDHSFDVELSLASIEGRVLTPDGKPVSGARVSAERYEPSSGGGRQVVRMIAMAGADGDSMMLGGEPGSAKPVITDEQGRYSLRGVLTGVELVVRATASGTQPAKSEHFDVADNEIKRGVDLTMERAGTIEVNAFKADGSPASMVVVTARPEGDELRGQEPKTAFIQDNGKTKLEGLAPGKWRVSLRPVGPPNGGGQAGAPEAQVIEVKADEVAPARFDLP